MLLEKIGSFLQKSHFSKRQPTYQNTWKQKQPIRQNEETEEYIPKKRTKINPQKKS